MDTNGLNQIIGNLKEEILRDVKEIKDDFHTFKTEEFYPLVKKVDKMWTKVAWVLGGYFVLNIVAWVVVRFVL